MEWTNYVTVVVVLVIFIGVGTNSFVIYKLLGRKRAIGDIFALNMAFVDVTYLALRLPNAINNFVDYSVPAFSALFNIYFCNLCYLASIQYFYLYMLTRFLVIVWPIEMSMYFKRWHTYVLVVLNLALCGIYMSGYLYSYAWMITSAEMVDYNTWFQNYTTVLRDQQPPFFVRFQKCYGNFIVLMFVLTVLLVVFVSFRLARKDSSDNLDVTKRKKQAIATICLCFFVFSVFQFSTVIVTLIYEQTGFVLNYITFAIYFIILKLQVIGFAINPLLYYKTKKATRSTSTKRTDHTNEQTNCGG
ncbi:hypothetical protein M3Y97_01060300 [Aphelenchoides bicaudatus]|nr:hypothetical protein M3Y97_01060300 [Aphelenchoides bicaudatus]